MDNPSDRRVSLAAWMTSPENPYFARAITNRVWANFFGVGLVEKVDDVRLSNPASNEALLKAGALGASARPSKPEKPGANWRKSGWATSCNPGPLHCLPTWM